MKIINYWKCSKTKISKLLTPFVIILMITGCGTKQKTADEIEDIIVPVQVIEISLDEIQETFSYTGSVEAWKEVNIVPDISGKVKRIYVEIGEQVKTGGILAELDRERFELQLKQAEAGLAVAQSSLADAERNYKRAVELHDRGSMSQQQFEKIQLAHDAARSQHKQAESALDLARWQVDVSVMKAPFSGVITGRWLNEGEMINPQMPGVQGVVSLMDLSRVKVRINTSEHEVVKIRKEQSVHVSTDVYPDRIFQGKVYAVNEAANPSTRTFEVQVVVPNPEGTLKAGMFTRLDVVTQEKEDIISIPRDAVLGTEESKYVYVVEGDNAVRRPVTLGIAEKDRIEVIEGLQTGERLVVVGQQMLQHGSKVSL